MHGPRPMSPPAIPTSWLPPPNTQRATSAQVHAALKDWQLSEQCYLQAAQSPQVGCWPPCFGRACWPRLLPALVLLGWLRACSSCATAGSAMLRRLPRLAVHALPCELPPPPRCLHRAPPPLCPCMQLDAQSRAKCWFGAAVAMHMQREDEAAIEAFQKAAQGAQTGEPLPRVPCPARHPGRRPLPAACPACLPQEAQDSRPQEALGARPTSPAACPPAPAPPDDLRVRSWVSQATLLRKAGQLGKAASLLKKAAKAEPRVEEAYLRPLLAEMAGGPPMEEAQQELLQQAAETSGAAEGAAQQEQQQEPPAAGEAELGGGAPLAAARRQAGK